MTFALQVLMVAVASVVLLGCLGSAVGALLRRSRERTTRPMVDDRDGLGRWCHGADDPCPYEQGSEG